MRLERGRPHREPPCSGRPPSLSRGAPAHQPPCTPQRCQPHARAGPFPRGPLAATLTRLAGLLLGQVSTQMPSPGDVNPGRLPQVSVRCRLTSFTAQSLCVITTRVVPTPIRVPPQQSAGSVGRILPLLPRRPQRPDGGRPEGPLSRSPWKGQRHQGCSGAGRGRLPTGSPGMRVARSVPGDGSTGARRNRGAQRSPEAASSQRWEREGEVLAQDLRAGDWDRQTRHPKGTAGSRAWVSPMGIEPRLPHTDGHITSALGGSQRKILTPFY